MSMSLDPVILSRVQFVWVIAWHILLPALTVGLASYITMLEGLHVWTGKPIYLRVSKFWIRIFAINFALGVVTGIPMEFQFGTNWAGFSRYAGGVVGHALAMEGLFAFFLESSFLVVLVWGERRVGRLGHWASALALWVGSWLSAYLVITANAFLQRPVGYAVGADGSLQLADFGAFMLNAWGLAQFAHTMCASVVTSAFVVAAVGAFYALRGVHAAAARRFLGLGVAFGLVTSILVAFPTGDRQAKLVAAHQPAALAAMEGRFHSDPI